MKLFALSPAVVILLPFLLCARAALRRKESSAQAHTLRRAATALQMHDSNLFCAYPSENNSTGPVQVYVGDDNSRWLAFGTDDMGTQTEIACKGELPSDCKPSRAHSQKNVLNCDDMPICQCDPDVDNLDFHYMNEMMDIVRPMCGDFGTRATQGEFNILVVGLGGGALPDYILKHCRKGTKVESIEYDPRVAKAAAKFFGLKLSQGQNEVESQDGGAAVQERMENGKRYDVVLVDAFVSNGRVPETCRNQAFVKGLQSILKPMGKAIQQVWNGDIDSTFKEYQQVFGDRAQAKDIGLGVNFLITADAPSQ
eukprot:gnl/TRDRNA2_/TRDRNA2_75600_c0_seq2.p1 gnl/TRDRNA2_/TRDRNA2_75600_c0~~gnl/TRDRNA2_/TRDRNA2_75600_c0_seq2.p1  ORF type:complete len:311 (+),score=55.01 gnl/TRDRNA2_/TRDRNA2_75600_c0_seq2:53-985(+)